MKLKKKCWLKQFDFPYKNDSLAAYVGMLNYSVMALRSHRGMRLVYD